MKRKYIYVTVFFLAVAIFTVIYGMAFLRLRNRQSQTKVQQIQADSPEEIRTTSETYYYLEKYMASKDQVEKKKDTMPAAFAGKTKEELQQTLNHYMEELPLKESLNGLTDFEIIEFSKEKLVLRKTYQDLAKKNRYYIKAVNGEIVVYYNDKKTVYEYTGIMLENLGEEEQIKTSIGYFVENDEVLYSILENYSS